MTSRKRKLPNLDVRELQAIYQRNSYYSRSINSQNTALQRWYEFRESNEGIPEKPDSGKCLAEFISWLAARNYRSNTIKQYLSGLSHMNMGIKGSNWSSIRADSQVKRTLEGIRKLESRIHMERSAKLEGTPKSLSPELIVRMIKVPYANMDYDEVLFFTLLTLGFYNLHRLAELVDADEEEVREEMVMAS
jgi:hypothetical protein